MGNYKYFVQEFEGHLGFTEVATVGSNGQESEGVNLQRTDKAETGKFTTILNT